MIGVTSSQAVWYLTRGTGTVSLTLLTAVTVLGILNAVRWTPAFTPRFVVQRVHRNLSLLAVVFIVIHIATAVIDGFAPIRWLDAVVPFRSAYRPLWLGLGAVAFDLVIAVAVTSLIRARLGYRAWRAVHWTSYALWGIAVFHGLGIGSDSKQVWMLALVAVSVTAVVAAAVLRVAVGWPGWSPARLSMALGAVSMPIVLGAWFVGGPLQPGWAARAGTPRQLLAHTSSAAPSPSSTVATVQAPIVLPSRASGQGITRLHKLTGGRARVVVSLQTQGSPVLTFRVVLNGQQIPQGISMSDGSVVLTPPGGAAVYRGTVSGLSGGNISAELSDGQGDRIALTLALEISAAGGQTSAQVLIQALATGSAQV
ncbi:MAG: ferric reductase-like transmembrane domain-containing protein [Actinomycetota bacterium]